MKKEKALLLAGTLGFFAAAGFIVIKKLAEAKMAVYQEYFQDVHRNFS